MYQTIREIVWDIIKHYKPPSGSKQKMWQRISEGKTV